MTSNNLVQALKNKDSLYGTLIVSSSPKWIKTVKGIGLDFVFIDTEHAALDREIVSWMCTAYSLAELAPIVRIPKADAYEACKFLDGGAEGIMIPYVESVQEVISIIGAVKYRPLKGLQLREVLEGKPLSETVKKYLSENNSDKTLWINIESPEGIKNLPEILQTGGVDVVVIGPHDMSISCGCPEDYNHPNFLNACSEVIKICKENNVSCACHYSEDKEKQIMWKKLGMNVCLYNSDIVSFQQKLVQDFNDIKISNSEKIISESESVNI